MRVGLVSDPLVFLVGAGPGHPNGPKHKAANELALQASAAEARAAVYGGPSSSGTGPSGGAGASYGGGESFFSKHKVPLLVGGGVLERIPKNWQALRQ